MQLIWGRRYKAESELLWVKTLWSTRGRIYINHKKKKCKKELRTYIKDLSDRKLSKLEEYINKNKQSGGIYWVDPHKMAIFTDPKKCSVSNFIRFECTLH